MSQSAWKLDTPEVVTLITLTHYKIASIRVEECRDYLTGDQAGSKPGFMEIWISKTIASDSDIVEPPIPGVYVKIEGEAYDNLVDQVLPAPITKIGELEEFMYQYLATRGDIPAGQLEVLGE